MSIKAILFDKDGVLLDLAHYWAQPTKNVFARIAEEVGFADTGLDDEILEKSGLLADSVEKNTPFTTLPGDVMAELWFQWIEEAGYTLPDLSAKEIEMQVIVEAQKICAIKPLGDLPFLFEELKKRDLIIGVLTGDEKSSCLFCLEKLGIIDYFHTGYYSVIKPDVKPIEDFLQRYNLSPQEVIYIGDSSADMIMAKKAKVTGLYFRPCDTNSIEGVHVIDSLNQILDFL